MRQLRRLGWFKPKPKVIVEIGGGLGYVARELGNCCRFEKQGIQYISLDVTRPFLQLQTKRAKSGGWTVTGTHANGECLPFKDNSVDLILDNENMADMTPVKLSRQELTEGRGTTAQHQEALDWIRRLRVPLDSELPDEVIFNLGPMRFVAEVWRVLKPGGRAFLTNSALRKAGPRQSNFHITPSTKCNTATCGKPCAGWVFRSGICRCHNFCRSNRTRRSCAPARPIPFSAFARDSDNILP